MNAIAPLLCASPCTVARLQHHYKGRLYMQAGGVLICHSSQELFALLEQFSCTSVWILDPRDIEPINIAARVKHMYPDVRVNLVSAHVGGSLRSRAYAAHIDALWDYALFFRNLDSRLGITGADQSSAPTNNNLHIEYTDQASVLSKDSMHVDCANQSSVSLSDSAHEEFLDGPLQSNTHTDDNIKCLCDEALPATELPSFPENFYCPDEESVQEQGDTTKECMQEQLRDTQHDISMQLPACSQTNTHNISTVFMPDHKTVHSASDMNSTRVAHVSQSTHPSSYDIHFSGNVISLMSGTGGSGKSTLAALLALYAARSGKRCVLLDASLQFADCAALLGIDNPTSYASMLRVLGIADPAYQHGCTSQSSPDSSVVPTHMPTQPFPFTFATSHEVSPYVRSATSCLSGDKPVAMCNMKHEHTATPHIETEKFAQHMQDVMRKRMPLCVTLGASLELAELYEPVLPVLIEALSEVFDVVIVNTSSYWSDFHALLLEKATHALMIIDQRVQSLNSACQVIDLCARCGIPTHSIHYILNKYTRKGYMSLERVKHALGDVKVHSVKYGGVDVEEKLLARAGASALGRKNPLWCGIEMLARDIMPTYAPHSISLDDSSLATLEE